MFTIVYTVGGGYDVHHNDGDKLSNCHIKNKMVLSYTTLTFIMDKHENMRPWIRQAHPLWLTFMMEKLNSTTP